MNGNFLEWVVTHFSCVISVSHRCRKKEVHNNIQWSCCVVGGLKLSHVWWLWSERLPRNEKKIVSCSLESTRPCFNFMYVQHTARAFSYQNIPPEVSTFNFATRDAVKIKLSTIKQFAENILPTSPSWKFVELKLLLFGFSSRPFIHSDCHSTTSFSSYQVNQCCCCWTRTSHHR